MARVLVVDDDHDLRQLIVSRLKAAGHQAAGTGTATEALELVAQRGAPEVAVLDVSLPDMDGYELLTRLRGEAPTHHMPAVFLSGRVGQADIEAGQAMSATYLTKPFVANALMVAIERAMAAAQVATGQGASEDGW